MDRAKDRLRHTLERASGLAQIVWILGLLQHIMACRDPQLDVRVSTFRMLSPMPPGLCMASPKALKVVRSMLWSMPKALCSCALVSPAPQARGQGHACLH